MTASAAIAQQLQPVAVCAYLRARGWNPAKSRRDDTAIYRSPGTPSVEVLVPLDRSLGDYAEAMTRLASRVAVHEGRPTDLVLRELAANELPAGYVAIQRRFRLVADETSGPWQGREGIIDWDSLVPITEDPSAPRRSATVIFAPSGMGKTSELRAQAVRLRTAGVAVFLMRGIDLALHGLEASLGDRRPFDEWKRTTERAVFMLDAIDEARVEGHDFEHVLAQFVRAVDPTTRSLKLIITSRNDVWTSENERHLVGALGLQDLALKVLTMDPLDERDIRAFAVHAGVPDVEQFSNAIADDELVQLLLPRPPDVRLLIEYWKEHGKFASWSRMLEASILASISDENQRHRAHQAFTLVEARAGLRRLAAATLLSQRALISLPGVSNSREVSSDRLFPEWVPGKTAQLLAMGVFAPKGAASVQLPQGATSEFLAAEWFVERFRAGYESERIEQQFLFQPFGAGRTIVPTQRLPLLGWVAVSVPSLRKRVLEELPSVLLFEGDASRLTRDEAKAALRRLVDNVRSGELRPSPTRGTLHQVAKLDLADLVVELLSANREHSEVQRLLLRLARAGRYINAVPISGEIAASSSSDIHNRVDAIKLVGQLGGDEERRDLLALAHDPHPTIRAAAIRALAPATLHGSGLINTLLSIVDDRELYALRRTLRKLTVADLDAILEQIVPALESSTTDSSTAARLTLAVYLLGVRLRRSPGDIPSWLGSLLRAIELRLDSRIYIPQEDRDALAQVLSENQVLRRELWNAKISGAPGSERLGRLMTPKLGIPLPEDFDWLLSRRDDRTLDAKVRDALMWSLRAALSTLTEDERALRIAKVTDPQLRAFLAPAASTSAAENEEAKRKAAEARKAARLRTKNAKEIAKRRAKIAAGEDENALTWAWRLLDGPATRYERVGIGDLVESVGVELAEVFIAGFRKWWRRYEPPFPVPGENRTPIAALVGLSGISFDVEAGLDFMQLSRSEARRAAIYALHEINGLPTWFDRLRAAHTMEVREILSIAGRDEWKASAEAHGLIARAPYESPGSAALIGEIVIGLMRGTPPGNPKILRYGVNTLVALLAQVSGALSFLRARVEEAHSTASDQLPEWLRAWVHVAPEACAAWIEGSARLSVAARSALVESIGAALEEDFDERPRRRGTLLWEPRALELWSRLLHASIRREDDIERVSGRMYSPGQRDHAQAFRDRCLFALARNPRREAREALVRLRDAVELASCRPIVERALNFQLVAAADAAARPWSEEEVLLAEKGDQRPPTTAEELFALVRAHLSRVANLLENDDFSYARLFAGDTDEREIQRWVASSLMLVNRGLYTVEREPQVQGENLIDISASAPGAGRVPLEIKPLSRGRYTIGKLRECIHEQLLGRYMRPTNVSHGILLLVLLESRTWRTEEGTIEFAQLVSTLQRFAAELGIRSGKQLLVATIDIASARAKLGRSTAPRP